MNLALFDFDGTITTRETFADFIRFAASPLSWHVGSVLLAPLVVGYRRGWVSGNVIRSSAVRLALKGMPQAHARALGDRFAKEVLVQVERTDVMDRIAWHRSRGDRIVVVSGALELYLAPWCRRHDLEWLCSRLEVRDGRLTGRYDGAQCVAQEKSRRVLEVLDTRAFDEVHVYGDTFEDFAMLRLASHASFRGRPWVDPEVSSGPR